MQEIIVITLFIFALGYLWRQIRKNFQKEQEGCGGSCGAACSGAELERMSREMAKRS